jgi:4-carboxymuconolactone decarboxylase
MARLQGAAGTGPVADLIRQRRGGELRPLDELLLLSPPVAEGWSVLLSAIRGELHLSSALRELVVLRIAVLNGAEYEWRAHESVARRCGLPEVTISALRCGRDHEPDAAVFSPAERAVLDYTDAMTVDVDVAPEIYAAVAALLGPRELVELTAIAATYNMVSRFLVALDVGGAEYGVPPDAGALVDAGASLDSGAGPEAGASGQAGGGPADPDTAGRTGSRP